MKIPLLMMPQKVAVGLAHSFHGISSRMLAPGSFLEKDLYKIESDMTAIEYFSVVLLNSLLYFLAVGAVGLLIVARSKMGIPEWWALAAALLCGGAIFMFMLLYPRWLSNRKMRELDKNLLYAARHLRIQTTAGVPLFDSLVSATHGYGMVSEEIKKIVNAVQAGENLAYAIEDSAAKNPSYYYNRIMWQVSNAVKAGTDVGPVLSEIVDFLAEEQRIDMRNYGAQLNTLAIMYLMMCIIAPTIGMIFLLVISSFIDMSLTDTIFIFFLGGIIFVQYMFIGMIENRRPAVSV